MAQTTHAGGLRRAEAASQRAPAQPAARLVLMVMCAGYFLVLLDVTIVNVPCPGSAVDCTPE